MEASSIDYDFVVFSLLKKRKRNEILGFHPSNPKI